MPRGCIRWRVCNNNWAKDNIGYWCKFQRHGLCEQGGHFKVKLICMPLHTQHDNLPYSCHSRTRFKLHSWWQKLKDALDISISEGLGVNVEVWVYWRVWNESLRCRLRLTTLTLNRPTTASVKDEVSFQPCAWSKAHQHRPIQTNPLVLVYVILYNVIAWPLLRVQAYICTRETACGSLSFASHLLCLRIIDLRSESPKRHSEAD